MANQNWRALFKEYATRYAQYKFMAKLQRRKEKKAAWFPFSVTFVLFVLLMFHPLKVYMEWVFANPAVWYQIGFCLAVVVGILVCVWLEYAREILHLIWELCTMPTWTGEDFTSPEAKVMTEYKYQLFVIAYLAHAKSGLTTERCREALMVSQRRIVEWEANIDIPPHHVSGDYIEGKAHVMETFYAINVF